MEAGGLAIIMHGQEIILLIKQLVMLNQTVRREDDWVMIKWIQRHHRNLKDLMLPPGTRILVEKSR